MKSSRLKTLAKKAVDGYNCGNLTQTGMGLSTSEVVFLHRLRLRENKAKISVFFYICLQVWNMYYEEYLKIIENGYIGTLESGDKIYPEVARIDKDIVTCMLLYSIHHSGKGNHEHHSYVENAYKIYRAKIEYDTVVMRNKVI